MAKLKTDDGQVKSLARELFVAMYGQHWHAMEKGHIARTAIESAEKFFEEWDNRPPPQGDKGNSK